MSHSICLRLFISCLRALRACSSLPLTPRLQNPRGVSKRRSLPGACVLPWQPAAVDAQIVLCCRAAAGVLWLAGPVFCVQQPGSSWQNCHAAAITQSKRSSSRGQPYPLPTFAAPLPVPAAPQGWQSPPTAPSHRTAPPPTQGNNAGLF